MGYRNDAKWFLGWRFFPHGPKGFFSRFELGRQKMFFIIVEKIFHAFSKGFYLYRPIKSRGKRLISISLFAIRGTVRGPYDGRLG